MMRPLSLPASRDSPHPAVRQSPNLSPAEVITEPIDRSLNSRWESLGEVGRGMLPITIRRTLPDGVTYYSLGAERVAEIRRMLEKRHKEKEEASVKGLE